MVDVAARSIRMWILLRGLRATSSLYDVVLSTGASDAAATITPMRLGGGPAQVATLVGAGVPLPRALSALGLEALVAYPVVLLVGTLLAIAGGASWRATTGPLLRAPSPRTLAIVLAGTALGIGLLALARRYTREVRRVHGPSLREELHLLRLLPWWAPAASLPLGLVQVLARVALLPVLAHTIPAPPSWRVSALGSFAMIYGQLVSPAPSGAGVVDYLGAHGLAGALGSRAVWVLGWWRAYSIAGSLFGVPLLWRLARRDPPVVTRARHDRSQSETESSRHVDRSGRA